MDLTKWWTDWQSADHAKAFDFRASVPSRILIRDFESFNDVQLLNESLQDAREKHLLEVGCATGDFYRYLRSRHPAIQYHGADVSKPAIERACGKYPEGRFQAVNPDWNRDSMLALCGNQRPEIVFSKDVAHHQVKPLEFISRLLQLPSETLVLRTRTRDQGPTEWDPEKSCQYHYNGWMPYIVINLTELIEHIRHVCPAAEVAVCRNRMVLGGKYNRYLPKDCYLEQTGTAETAIRVSMVTAEPGKVTAKDRADANPNYSYSELFLLGLRRLTNRLRSA